MEFLFLFLGFILLIKGANYIVDGASFLAENFNVPALVIGFTIVAFCTSAPELFVSLTASFKHQDSLAFGTVIGSNIFNLLIVVGLAGFIKTLYIEKASIYKEFPFLVFSSILVLILCLDFIFGQSNYNILSRNDGLILIIFFAIFMYSLLNVTLKPRKKFILNESAQLVDLDNYNASYSSTTKTISPARANALLAIGLVGLILGSQIVVYNCIVISSNYGLNNQFLGLTLVSIATSLPEFIIAIIAVTRSESDIALGNIIGSNVFNTLFILGVSSLLSPMYFESNLIFDMIFMIISIIITYLFALREKDINKFESIILICIYLFYILYVFSSS